MNFFHVKYHHFFSWFKRLFGIQNQNFAPLSQELSTDVDEDAAVELNLFDRSIDPDGDLLTLVSVDGAEHGSILDNGNGSVTYRPDPNYNGSDSFSYTISDEHGATSSAIVNVSVQPVNDAPSELTLSNTTIRENATIGTVVGTFSASDEDGDDLTYSLHPNSSDMFALVGNKLVVKSSLDFGIAVSHNVELIVSDENGAETNAAFSIEVEDINFAPLSQELSTDVDEDAAVELNLFDRSIDPDGDLLTLVSVDGAEHGSILDNGNGSVTYRPDPNYNGSDSFSYTISDEHGATSSAIVNVSVQPVNDAPTVILETSFEVQIDHTTQIPFHQILTNVTDADNDMLDIIEVNGAINGVAEIANGVINFTPSSVEDATFNYVVSDGNDGLTEGTVTLDVQSHADEDNPTDGEPPYGEISLIDAISSQRMIRDHAEHFHGDNGMLASEYAELLRLFPNAADSNTAVALKSGSWFSADTWSTGIVPVEGQNVYIPQAVAVLYDGVSEVSINVLAVDGKLDFSRERDSQIKLDTLLTGPSSVLEIGTADQPIPEGVNVNIIIANNGGIDVNWDPTLISRGVVTLGAVDMHGSEKDTHLKVSVDPIAGETMLVLDSEPEGWLVGDKIVVAGTNYDGYKWARDTETGSSYSARWHENEDEVVSIVSISGNIVEIDRPLAYDHTSPRQDLKTSAANFTRNILIESEGSAEGATHERGHVMFMHNSDVDVRYVEFSELGRTDKSFEARNPIEFDSIDAANNVKGRYALHFHRTGLEDIENPAVAEGNAIFGSPGWGVVHHDSNATIHDNATYGTFGAGFVAETGNEIGTWSDNIAIFAQGRSWASPKNGNDYHNFDNGSVGSGFYFQGRMVEALNNIAVSTNSGFTFLHRAGPSLGVVSYDEEGNRVITRTKDHLIPEGAEVIVLDGPIPFDSSLLDLPEIKDLSTRVNADDAPIMNFTGNETFASNYGLFVEKSNPNQEHDVRSVLEGFTAWDVLTGAHLAYTSHYTLKNFDLVGKEAIQVQKPQNGIKLGINSSDVVIIDSKICGFGTGISVSSRFSNGIDPSMKQHVSVNNSMESVGQEYSDDVTRNPEIIQIKNDYDLSDRFEIEMASDLALATMKIYHLGVAIDGIKTDSIGSISLPAGIDNYDSFDWDAKRAHERVIEENGYFKSSEDGKYYYVLEDYYSDRGTTEIFKWSGLIDLSELKAQIEGTGPNSDFWEKNYRGEFVLSDHANVPLANDDIATTSLETDVVIDLLSNDVDPDGDALTIDGLFQPANGRIFDNEDGTVTYRPDFEFIGIDTIKYWVTDSFGNYGSGIAEVTVTGPESQFESQMFSGASEDWF